MLEKCLFVRYLTFNILFEIRYLFDCCINRTVTSECKPSTDDRFSSDFVFCWPTKSADKNWPRISADFSKHTRDFRRRTKRTTMRLRLCFFKYNFSKEDVENVKRTDQLGPDPGLWKGLYALYHAERFISSFFFYWSSRSLICRPAHPQSFYEHLARSLAQPPICAIP